MVNYLGRIQPAASLTCLKTLQLKHPLEHWGHDVSDVDTRE